jgi:hypothetical protein
MLNNAFTRLLRIPLYDSLRLFQMTFGFGAGNALGRSRSRFAIHIDVSWFLFHDAPQR